MEFPHGYILAMVTRMCNDHGIIPDFKELKIMADKYIILASKLN